MRRQPSQPMSRPLTSKILFWRKCFMPIATAAKVKDDTPPASIPTWASTSVDEFAQALSEVIGTVEETEASDQASGDYRVPWQSSDGVVIEDGFTPPPGAMPPPLPLNDTSTSE